MRIAILYSRLSGYFTSCLRALKQRDGVQLLIYAWPTHDSAPFGPDAFADLGEIHCRSDRTNFEIRQNLQRFRPDAILVSGWVDPGYVDVCREMKRRGTLVIAGCDTQWTGSVRQRLAGAVAPWHLRRFIDVLWVTGERQRILARALGYTGERCWDGYYSCDWSSFDRAMYGTRPRLDGRVGFDEATDGGSPYFVYVGRYVGEKGLDTLVKAYAAYRTRVCEPWGLRCAGAGPMRHELVKSGAIDLGFIQPERLPSLFAHAGAFILPSKFEPWGVVAHEAATSGLPLILSDACGAGAHLLRHLYNGYSFPAGNVEALGNCLVAMHDLDAAQRMSWGQASYELSKQYTPTRWVDTLFDGLTRISACPP